MSPTRPQLLRELLLHSRIPSLQQGRSCYGNCCCIPGYHLSHKAAVATGTVAAFQDTISPTRPQLLRELLLHSRIPSLPQGRSCYGNCCCIPGYHLSHKVAVATGTVAAFQDTISPTRPQLLRELLLHSRIPSLPQGPSCYGNCCCIPGYHLSHKAAVGCCWGSRE